ncbi:MAG TPA: DnaJ domain-containing protein [Kofleriaceae bacterium]
MADAPLSIKLRCASWQQLATIYRRDLSHGTMFLRAATPPPLGTAVHIDLTLPSATVIALTGAIATHVQDPQRGAGVEIKLAPIAESAIWLIESALASEHRRLASPTGGSVSVAAPSPHQVNSAIPTIADAAELTDAERDLVKALVSEAESLKKLNPFLVLGVGYEATDAEVRAAFGDLTKRYHPDRFARYESAELREVAAEIFILIRDAYRRLGDAASRVAVLQSLGKGSASTPRAVPGPSRPPATVPAPPVNRQRSVVQSLQPASGHAATTPITPITGPITGPISGPISGPITGPVSASPAPPPSSAALSPATTILPASQAPRLAPTVRRPTTNQPIQAPLHGQSDPVDVSALEDLIDQARLDEALSGYRALAKRYPADRNVRAGSELVEGLMALNVRDRLEAAQRFEAALEIDPSNERAARELADMRRQATNERKGLLSRLMGKKEP